MISLPKIKIHLVAAATTWQRFPLPLSAALSLAAVMIARTHGWIGNGSSLTFFGQFEILLLLSFFLLFAIALWAERSAVRTTVAWALSAAGVALLALYVFTSPTGLLPVRSETFLLLAPGLVLLVAVAPCLERGSSDFAFWDFNRALIVGAGFGLLIAALLASGLAAAYGLLDILLGIDIALATYRDTGTVCFALIWPWLALSGVPRADATARDVVVPRLVNRLASYILVPLTIVYFAIVYVYIGKLLAQWALPQGRVAWLMFIYASLGVTVYYLTLPLRDTGPALTRWYHRFFFLTLFAPTVLMAVALAVRVREYGITQPRYALLLFTGWLAFSALMVTIRRATPRRYLPALMAVLLIAGSFGPWGAGSVSYRSQLAQLEGQLERFGLLTDSRVVPWARPISSRFTKRVREIVSYMLREGRGSDLQEWLDARGIQIEDTEETKEIVQALGFALPKTAKKGRALRFRAIQSTSFQTAGYEIISQTRFHATGSREIVAEGSGRRYTLAFDRDAGTFVVTSGAETVQLDLMAVFRDLPESATTDRGMPDHDPILLEGRAGPLRVRAFVQQIDGVIREDKLRLSLIRLNTLIGWAN